jgi:hypothetical protein
MHHWCFIFTSFPHISTQFTLDQLFGSRKLWESCGFYLVLPCGTRLWVQEFLEIWSFSFNFWLISVNFSIILAEILGNFIKFYLMLCEFVVISFAQYMGPAYFYLSCLAGPVILEIPAQYRPNREL